jgi:hypothetical protein
MDMALSVNLPPRRQPRNRPSGTIVCEVGGGCLIGVGGQLGQLVNLGLVFTAGRVEALRFMTSASRTTALATRNDPASIHLIKPSTSPPQSTKRVDRL